MILIMFVHSLIYILLSVVSTNAQTTIPTTGFNNTNTTNTTVAPYNPYADPYVTPTVYNNTCKYYNLIGGICSNTTVLTNGVDSSGTILTYPLPWNWPTYTDDQGDSNGDIYDTNICHIHFVCSPSTALTCDPPLQYIPDPCNPSGTIPSTQELIDQYFNYTNIITMTNNDPTQLGLGSWSAFPTTFSTYIGNAWGSHSYTIHSGSTSPPIGLIIGTGQQQVLKSMFYPTVDSMSLLQLERSVPYGNSTATTTQNFSLYADWHWDAAVTVVLEVNAGNPANTSQVVRSTPVRRFGVYSPPSAPSSGGTLVFTPMIVPFWTAIITASAGIIQSVEWDTDCSLCSNAYCLDGVCAIDPSTCSVYGGATDCDVKIYVAWGGTDSSNTPLLSTNQRLSQFRRWSFAGAFNAASNWLPNTLPTLPQDGNIASRPVTVSGTYG